MGTLSGRKWIVFVCLFAALTPGCLVRRRVVTRQGKKDTRPLLNATKQELLDQIRTRYEAIHTFTATLDMTPAVGSVYKGEISEFPSVRGYVLFRKPESIRIIGLDPVIHTRAFDMVSLGADFRLSIPSKNQFIEGKNDAPANSANKLENLRPQAFLRAMLIYPPAEDETTVLEDDTDEEHTLYILLILKKDGDEFWLQRAIYFDRLTLMIVQQKTFNRQTQTINDTRYSDYKAESGVLFPTTIDINRPQDGYGVVMKLLEMKMNTEVGVDKFELVKPEGAKVRVIGEER